MQMVSPAETLFGGLDAGPNNVGGQAIGMLLHPNRAYQRRYGFQRGDVLIAVNGSDITDPNQLAEMLKNENTSTWTLTYLRQGVPHVVSMSSSD